jgi:thiosulfate/3-mercaptopyruvate sulfurtransferase
MSENFTHPEYLIETDWLAGHLQDPQVRVFDCTTHLIPDPKITYQVVPGRSDFEKAHIPGAQFIDIQADVSEATSRLRFMLPSADTFAAAMRRFGVSSDTRVILYSSANAWWAARVWWLLHIFGHDNAAVLNGGMQKWISENRAMERGPAKSRPAGNFTAQETRDLMVGKDEVRAAVGDPDICTINALTAEQHAGTGGNTYGRPGHITGSVNVPAASLLDPATNTFLPAETLRACFAQRQAMERPVITYCGGGIAASADAFILVMLGHPNVRLYDASLSEWAADPTLPMETGT